MHGLKTVVNNDRRDSQVSVAIVQCEIRRGAKCLSADQLVTCVPESYDVKVLFDFEINFFIVKITSKDVFYSLAVFDPEKRKWRFKGIFFF